MRAIALVAAGLSLGGCADYLANRDSVTLGVGNAMEANVGIHTQDPFPPHAQQTYIPGDGKKVAQAMRGYYAVPAVVVTPPSGANGDGNGGGSGMAAGN
ncbi:hypothetical protein KEU06_05580 [Pseudaminobacter sp. 19-2017]|uniref:Uncharacterized protein n=1 Tax=Pseudaminobacter soli (ex Zhang et al. 2022) TaxID=2831468 RepID=A0A942DVH3_9HYPH|nr:hypothetical protein [Pseudaminobacter soli]MBS3648099.1 hypothetical protein [Pseudaminobacter soli]